MEELLRIMVEYLRRIEETNQYILRELRNKNGGSGIGNTITNPVVVFTDRSIKIVDANMAASRKVTIRNTGTTIVYFSESQTISATTGQLLLPGDVAEDFVNIGDQYAISINADGQVTVTYD